MNDEELAEIQNSLVDPQTLYPSDNSIVIPDDDEDITSKGYTAPDFTFYYDIYGHLDAATNEGMPTIKLKICECGKDKHNFARHSDWCDLYE